MSSLLALAWPIHASVFAIVVLCASGIGRLALGSRACLGLTRVRRLAAEVGVGVLGWSVLLGALNELSAPLAAALVVLGGFLVAGLASVFVQLRNDRRTSTFRISLVLLLGASMLVAGITPVNPGAADPVNYAYIAATLFRSDWLARSLNVIPDTSWYIGLAQEGMLARSPAVGLIWPTAVLGWPVESRSVAGVAAWLLGISFLLIVDLLHGRAPLLIRTVLAAGGIAAFNVTAVLVGGQINQAFAIAAALTGVWVCRWVNSTSSRVLVLLLTGSAITAAYPEFLVVVPLYFLSMVLVRTDSWRQIGVSAAGLAAGVVLMFALSRFGILDYLLSKSGQGPGWWPLPEDPHNVMDEWRAIIFQRLPPRLTLLLLIPTVWLGWRTRFAWGSSGSPRSLYIGVVLAMCALLAVWSWFITQAPNVNYATFKVGGWIGPSLIVLCWLLASVASPMLRRSAAAVLLSLAVVRSLGMLADVASVAPLYAAAPRVESFSQAPPEPDGRCIVVVSSTNRAVVLAAVAASAAPARNCDLTAG